MHGKRTWIGLIDGTTIEGTFVFSWGWWSFKVVDATIHGMPGQPATENQVRAIGYFKIPRKSVQLIQVIN